MGFDATVRRRWLGGLVLAGALLMLIGGETVFQGRLSALGFLAYWLACLGLTGVAMVLAVLDVRALQRRTRQEQRELFEATLQRIEKDVKKP